VTGVEALVRWQHPQHGLVFPDRFIPAAERTGLIQQLTLVVLDQALAQGRRWRQQGLDLPVAVNLSPRCLLDLKLPDAVRRLLERHETDPTDLELEITESSVMADPQRAIEVLTQLHAIGVRLSIDDFGTGYSSMAYLKQLPVDVLKIDRVFVLDMVEDASDAAIVRSSVDLAHNLGLSVVAEGVETAEIWDRLDQLGCDSLQGYFLARPMPGARLAAWLEAYEARPLADVRA
jgi:EAL domain-containing protein (putative c-di-GMP-specific phosphodiesterase class I)